MAVPLSPFEPIVNISSLFRVLSVAALAVSASSGVVQAQSFLDGDFQTGWSRVLVVHHSCCDDGTAATDPGFGNPGWQRVFSNTVYGGIAGNAHLSPFSWNPSTQGAITGAGMSFDYSVTNAASAFAPLISQNGLYWSSTHNYFAEGVFEGWHHFAQGTLGVANGDWTELCQGYGYTACNGDVPDFSASGGAITFGLLTMSSGSNSIYTAAGGFDNFDVNLDGDFPQSSAPEPASIVLVATGLAGITTLARRRRS